MSPQLRAARVKHAETAKLLAEGAVEGHALYATSYHKAGCFEARDRELLKLADALDNLRRLRKEWIAIMNEERYR